MSDYSKPDFGRFASAASDGYPNVKSKEQDAENPIKSLCLDHASTSALVVVAGGKDVLAGHSNARRGSSQVKGAYQVDCAEQS